MHMHGRGNKMIRYGTGAERWDVRRNRGSTVWDVRRGTLPRTFLPYSSTVTPWTQKVATQRMSLWNLSKAMCPPAKGRRRVAVRNGGEGDGTVSKMVGWLTVHPGRDDEVVGVVGLVPWGEESCGSAFSP